MLVRFRAKTAHRRVKHHRISSFPLVVFEKLTVETRHGISLAEDVAGYLVCCRDLHHGNGVVDLTTNALGIRPPVSSALTSLLAIQ